MSIKYICYPRKLLPIDLIDMLRNDYSIINIIMYFNKIVDLNDSIKIQFYGKKNYDYYIEKDDIIKFSTFYNNIIYMPIIPILSLDENRTFKEINVRLYTSKNIMYIELEIIKTIKLCVINVLHTKKYNSLIYIHKNNKIISTDCLTLSMNYIINYISNLLNLPFDKALEYFYNKVYKIGNFVCISYLKYKDLNDLHILEIN